MDLQEDTALVAAFFHFLLHGNHGKLHDICGRALDGRIHGHTFSQGPAHEILAMNVRQLTVAAEEGGGPAGFLGLLDHVIHEAVDLRIASVVLIDVVLRFFRRDAKLLRQAKGADAVDDAEVYRLRVASLLRRHILEGDAQDFRRCAPVDVLAAAESPDETFVAAHVGQDAKLHLGVVGGNKGIVSLAGHEEGADLPAFFCADRDVLQIRIRAGKSAGGGDSLIEGGVDAPRFPANQKRQRVEIGGNQFRQRAVAKDFLHEGIVHGQIFQDVRGGGVAGLGPLPGRKAQLFEKDDAQLLGRIDIERLAGFGVNISYKRADLLLHAFLHFLPAGLVRSDAGLLHGSQHLHQGTFHGLIEHCHAIVVQFLSARFVNGEQERRCETAFLFEGFQLIRIHCHRAIQSRHIRKRIGHAGGIQEIGSNGDIEERKISAWEIGLHERFRVHRHHNRCVRKGFGESFILIGLGEEYMVSFGDANFLSGMERRRAGQGCKEGCCLSGKAFALPRHNFCQGRAAFFFLFFCQLLETRQRCELGEQIDAQLFEKLLHLGAMDRLLHFLQAALHGHVSLDGGQPVRQVSHVFVRRQLFPESSFDFVYVRIDFIQRAVLGNQFQCRLLTHAGDAGDIVRRIAHEGFHIDHLRRRDVVLLFHRSRRHGCHLGDALLREVHRSAVAGKLQRIAVASDDVDRHFLLITKRERP